MEWSWAILWDKTITALFHFVDVETEVQGFICHFSQLGFAPGHAHSRHFVVATCLHCWTACLPTLLSCLSHILPSPCHPPHVTDCFPPSGVIIVLSCQPVALMSMPWAEGGPKWDWILTSVKLCSVFAPVLLSSRPGSRELMLCLFCLVFALLSQHFKALCSVLLHTIMQTSFLL